MLHIILGILKIIGILLAILFLLLLAVFLAVLFVPARYQGRLKKDREEMSGSLTLTWLLHLLAVEAILDSFGGMEPKLEIRIFGIPLERIRGFLSRLRSRKKHTASPSSGAGPASSPEPPFLGDALHGDGLGGTETGTAWPSDDLSSAEDSSPSREAGLSDADSSPNREADLSAEDSSPSREAGLSDEDSSPSREAGLSEAESGQEVGASSPDQEKTGAGQQFRIFGDKLRRIPGWLGAFPQRLRRIGSRIQELLGRIRKLLQSLLEILAKLPDLPEQISGKTEAFAGKIQEIFDTLEEYEVIAAIGDGKDELLALLHHYRFREITGSLRYGTGDPSSTGQLTGVLCLLLPARSELVLMPDFTEASLEADVAFSGHIRLCHLVTTAWHIFRSKRLMRLIRFLRGRKTGPQKE